MARSACKSFCGALDAVTPDWRTMRGRPLSEPSSLRRKASMVTNCSASRPEGASQCGLIWRLMAWISEALALAPICEAGTRVSVVCVLSPAPAKKSDPTRLPPPSRAGGGGRFGRLFGRVFTGLSGRVFGRAAGGVGDLCASVSGCVTSGLSGETSCTGAGSSDNCCAIEA